MGRMGGLRICDDAEGRAEEIYIRGVRLIHTCRTVY